MILTMQPLPKFAASAGSGPTGSNGSGILSDLRTTPQTELLTSPVTSLAISASASMSQFNRSLVPIGPGQISASFDVIAELQSSTRDHYANVDRTSLITIYEMPLAIEVSLDRLRERITPSKPSFDVSISCCAANGISALAKDPNIRELLLLRRRLNLLEDDADATHVEEVLLWLNKCDILLPESKKRKSTIFMPDWLKTSVAGLAKPLGVSGWTLFLLSVMTTLITQRPTLSEHREVMRKTVNKFHRRTELRRKIGAVLLETIDPTEQTSDIDDQMTLNI